ncbi:MAG: SDR family NAD(P)-dependent oxidoreductase [Xanthobacteraceae bacterium]|jgi:2-hydroxycyclohexanecarboxyl-CoA dehydrogenase
MKFDDQIVMVTGGASGIGRATVMEFARCGALVISADIDAKKGAEVENEARRANLAVEYVSINLAESASIRSSAAAVLAKHPRIDVLVNAAGWNDIQSFVENSPDYMERVIAINLGGTLHLTQALLPVMMAAGKGKIVNVSSDAGRVGSSGETTYAAAKGGVIAFTKSLAREVARYSINVNCVCPGPTDTPMLQSRPEKLREAFLKAIPFRRFAKPQDIADAIVFFASSRSDYITGQVMSVSGGLTFAG